MKNPSTTCAHALSPLDLDALEAVVGGQQDWGAPPEDTEDTTLRFIANAGVRIYARPGVSGQSV